MHLPTHGYCIKYHLPVRPATQDLSSAFSSESAYEVFGTVAHTGIGPSGSDKEPELGDGRLRAHLTNITRSRRLVQFEPMVWTFNFKPKLR